MNVEIENKMTKTKRVWVSARVRIRVRVRVRVRFRLRVQARVRFKTGKTGACISCWDYILYLISYISCNFYLLS